MKTHIIYGAGMAAAGAVLMLVLNLWGFHNDPGKILLGMALGLLSMLMITLVGVVLGIRAVRAAGGPGKFSYGQALVAGLIITAISSVAGTGFQVIYHKFINPNYSETTIAWAQSMMEKANRPSSEIEEKITEMRKKFEIGSQIRDGLIAGMVIGSFFSLIAAAFLKRKPENEIAQV